jgi:hypothetical protein
VLFDYESKKYTVGQLNISSSGYLLKNHKEIIYQSNNKITNEYISTISLKDDEYNFKIDERYESPCDRSERTLDEKLWIVIKSTNFDDEKGYRLREGNIIKLGKLMFKVKELKSDGKKSTQMIKIINREKNMGELPSNNIQNSIIRGNIELEDIHKQVVNKKKASPSPCRICLMDDNELDNPLITPCNCIGSCRFIHLRCIREWLNSKISVKIFNFISVISLKNNFECEICKAELPGIIFK